MPAFWPHAESLDWWDGPERHKRINRCQVAEIQNETTLAILNAIYGPRRKVDMGGPSVPLGMNNPVMRGWDVCNLRDDVGATLVGDLCATPYAADFFSAVVTFHTIEHVAEPKRFLHECDRILRPSGLLVIVCPHRNYVSHDMGNMAPEHRCYSEWLPEELLWLFRAQMPAYTILGFDTRNNHYDFDIVARKP